MHDLCHRDGGPLVQGLVLVQFLLPNLEGIVYWDLCEETDDVKTSHAQKSVPVIPARSNESLQYHIQLISSSTPKLSNSVTTTHYSPSPTGQFSLYTAQQSQPSSRNVTVKGSELPPTAQVTKARRLCHQST